MLVREMTNPDWNPGDTDRLLLAGDETAIDTIALILATLPAAHAARCSSRCSRTPTSES